MSDDLTPDELQIAFHDVECATYDERFGIAYDEGTAQQVQREVRRLVGELPPGRVLDVGCGTGYIAVGLAAAQPTSTVHGVDISPGMLDRARDNAARLDVEPVFVRAAADRLPYADGTFDAVISRGVLHHLDDPVRALQEWRRVVRDGCPVLVLSEPTTVADRVGGWTARLTAVGLRATRRASEAVGRPLSRHDADAADEHHFWDLVAMAANLHTFSPEELAALGRMAGFGQTEVRGSGLASIIWAAGYYYLVGELPDLAESTSAKRRAGRVWAWLRRLDAAVLARIVPDGGLLTVQAVFRR